MRYVPPMLLIPLVCLLLYGSFPAPALSAAVASFQAAEEGAEPELVRVNIVTESRGTKDVVQINGKKIANYSPVIIRDFPCTGIVLDRDNYILTFLGYRWVDIQDSNPRIVISASDGRKWKGRLIGIDQSNGVAVIQLLNGKLRKTPVCVSCEVRDGVRVMAPVMENPREFLEAQVLSVGTGVASLDPGALVMKTSRLIPGIGLPVLTQDMRVLGFVAGLDPLDARVVIYPVSQMIASAEKILKAGGDIRTGWLGVFLDTHKPSKDAGVKILQIEKNSPAQRAGLLPGDVLLKIDGREVKDALQFIQLIQNTPIGSKVKLDVMRQGQPLKSAMAMVEARQPRRPNNTLSFNLIGSPGPDAKGMVPELSPPSPGMLMGLTTEMLNPRLAEALRLPGPTGLLVLDVSRDMPAEQAGVLVGDIILSIDGQPIVDPPSFASFLMTHAWREQSVLRVLRNGTEHTIVVQLPLRTK